MTSADDRGVQALIDRAVAARVTPGVVVEIGTRERASARWTAGTLTYERGARAVSGKTWYDLASLTKVIATGSIAMQAVTSGMLPIEACASDRLPAFAGVDRRDITVEDLLLHTAGFPAHRPYYRACAGRAAVQAAIVNEPLTYRRRSRSEYSDLGFMLLGWLLADALDRPLAQAFSSFVDAALGDVSLSFGRPPADEGAVAPTEAEGWRGRVLVGDVHDANAAALGGAAGHAGLFGTAEAVGAFARWFLTLWTREDAVSAGVSSDVVRRFARRGQVPGSSRALAWDTMMPTSSCGRLLSPAAIGHTGFTGTSLWIDPIRDLYVVLLTNRVHPSSAGTADGVRQLRVDLHEAVARA